jgi:predicted Zn finger-like uncharacterized protein
MIIICNKCSIHFNLDASLLKAGGSKVRCGSCNHVFTVFPQVPESRLESEEELLFDFSGLEFEIDDLEMDAPGEEAFEIEISFDSEGEIEDDNLISDDFDFDESDLVIEAQANQTDFDNIKLDFFDQETLIFETDTPVAGDTPIADVSISYDAPKVDLMFDEPGLEQESTPTMDLSDDGMIIPNDKEALERKFDQDFFKLS